MPDVTGLPFAASDKCVICRLLPPVGTAKATYVEPARTLTYRVRPLQYGLSYTHRKVLNAVRALDQTYLVVGYPASLLPRALSILRLRKP